MKEIVEGVHGVLPANGIGLSPDEKPSNRGDANRPAVGLRYSAPGMVKPRDVIYRGERGKPIAGSAATRCSIARGRGERQCLRRHADLGLHSVIAPDGTLVEQVPTGDRVTTNIAFGGPELKTAYITLSGKGELVAMDWPRPGLALNFLNK